METAVKGLSFGTFGVLLTLFDGVAMKFMLTHKSSGSTSTV